MRPPKGVMSIVSRKYGRATEASFANLAAARVDRDYIAEIKRVSMAMRRAGVRHALIGGMALGVYGYVRATQDADFLIGREGVVIGSTGDARTTDIVHEITENADMNIDALAIVAPIPTMQPSFLDALETMLDAPFVTEGVPVAPAEYLVALKLASARREDLADVVRLVRAGLTDIAKTRDLLVNHATAATLGLFDGLVRESQEGD